MAISFIEAPIDLIKTKLQIQVFGPKLTPLNVKAPIYSTVLGCVKHTVGVHGVSALWQGLGATIIRNIPANAMFFPVCHMTKMEFSRRSGKPLNELSLHHRLIAGACAGLCYWVITYPLDAIKGTVQAAAFEDRKGWLKTVTLPPSSPLTRSPFSLQFPL